MPDVLADDNVNVFVFGGFPGARYRAGRTLRSLNARFQKITDATHFSHAEFAAALRATKSFVWLLRAGTWPAHLDHFFAPPEVSGQLCAFGALVNPSLPTATQEPLFRAHETRYRERVAETQRWSEIQNETGGDFSRTKNLVAKLPPLSSVLLGPQTAAALASALAENQNLDQALHAVLNNTTPRTVRAAHLDVLDDPALRVAQVVTSLQRGGAERIALELARELPRHGIRPLFFALGAPTRAAFDRPDSFVDFERGVNREEHVTRFARRVVETACDVVHSHLLSPGDMEIIASFGLPQIATVHNVRQGWPAGFERVKGVQMLAACAQAVERDLLAAGIEVPVRTIWNGIDPKEFTRRPEQPHTSSALRAKLGIAPDDCVLLSLANPRPQKRLEKLPAILSALQSEFAARKIARRVRLVIAGEASRSSPDARASELALQNEIARLSLSEHVILCGAAENVATLLHASDALVSVSAWEGLSLAHLEALASGIPVVATDAGGTSEIAHENPRMKVLPLDATPETFAVELAAQLQSTAERPATAFNKGSFTLDKMASRCASFYPRVIESQKGPRRGAGLFLVANNFSTGGAQSSARRLLLGLKSRGVPVRAAVLQEHEENTTPGLRALRSAGIDVFIPEPRSADPLDAVMQILEHIDAHPPRAILFWNAIAEHKILLVDALSDIPIFDVSPGEMCFDSLETYFRRPRPGMPYLSGSDYGKRLTGVVVKYQREAERAAKMLGCKTHVVPNGLPLEEWPEPDWSLAPARDAIVIGTSARISPQKKLEELIAALRIVKNELPPHILKIAGGVEAGSEDYFERLKELSAGLNIVWVGEFQHSREFLAGLDIFAMISEPAGCPNASLEAMAAGLPLVATDHGGASEQVLNGQTGFLTERGNAAALSSALLTLARDANLRAAFGRAGREHVKQRFSLERMIADYQQICL